MGQYIYKEIANSATQKFVIQQGIIQSEISRSIMSAALQPHGLQPARFLCPQNCPSNKIGVGNHSLLQRIFPTQGSNSSLLHCRQNLHCLSHQGSRETNYRSVTEWLLNDKNTSLIYKSDSSNNQTWTQTSELLFRTMTWRIYNTLQIFSDLRIKFV